MDVPPAVRVWLVLALAAVAYSAEAAAMLSPPVRAWTKAHRTSRAQPDHT